jgi:hypothetical protein
MEIGGLEIGGHEFQLERELSPEEVLKEIAAARQSRLAELRVTDPGHNQSDYVVR